MAAADTDVQMCNMAASLAGSRESVNSLTNPITPQEKIFSLWYDTVLDLSLRRAMPNFAMARRKVAKLTTTPAFGYAYEYEKPADCLRVLGFGDIDAKDLDFSVEGETLQTDENYTDGLPLRFIKRVTNVALYTADFKMLFAENLAAVVSMVLTQDPELVQFLRNDEASRVSQLSGIAAQENPPIRINNSKFREARYGYPQFNGRKK